MTLSAIKEIITAFDLKLTSLLSQLHSSVLALDTLQAKAIIAREDFSLGEKWARLLKIAEKAQESHANIYREAKDLNEIFIIISQQRNELFIQSLQYKDEPIASKAAETSQTVFNIKDLPPPPPRRQSQTTQSSLYARNAGQEDFCPAFPMPPSTPPQQPGQSPKMSRACSEVAAEEVDSSRTLFRNI
ncbi:MAG: hypothetical protein K0S08_116 [Gammaproteobacteria bacterium]|jgi:hypothetical protein|nr:hypothetical protein [Gammaproteobacteria bacterium]